MSTFIVIERKFHMSIIYIVHNNHFKTLGVIQSIILEKTMGCWLSSKFRDLQSRIMIIWKDSLMRFEFFFKILIIIFPKNKFCWVCIFFFFGCTHILALSNSIMHEYCYICMNVLTGGLIFSPKDNHSFLIAIYSENNAVKYES